MKLKCLSLTRLDFWSSVYRNKFVKVADLNIYCVTEMTRILTDKCIAEDTEISSASEALGGPKSCWCLYWYCCSWFSKDLTLSLLFHCHTVTWSAFADQYKSRLVKEVTWNVNAIAIWYEIHFLRRMLISQTKSAVTLWSCCRRNIL